MLIPGDEEECKFVEYNSYIKIQCTARNKVENETLTYFKCPNSDVNYVVRRGCKRQNDPKMIRRQFSAVCQNDTKFYQVSFLSNTYFSFGVSNSHVVTMLPANYCRSRRILQGQRRLRYLIGGKDSGGNVTSGSP